MSKVYDRIPLDRYQQAKSENFNKNIETYLGEFNGNMDGQNMPVNALQASHLKTLVVPETDVTASNVYKRSSRGPTQSYYDSRIMSWDVTDIWTPLDSIDLGTDDWRRGWNKLDDYSTFSTIPLEFIAREGMLVGCATIDWHRGANVVQIDSVQTLVGEDWWTEWGVFANGLLVARSGFIYPRRHTTQLPFSVPVGSQNVKLDIRFRTKSSKVLGYTGDPSTTLDIFSVETWVRNQYR